MANGFYGCVIPEHRCRARSILSVAPVLVAALTGCAAPGTLPTDPLPAVCGAGPLCAGAGAADLTPTLDPRRPLPLAGYGSRGGDPLQGVHDHVHARALVLSAGGVSVAIVSADLLLFHEELARKIREQVADLPLASVLLAATHNHSGPGGYFDNWLAETVALGPYDETFFQLLAARIAGAVRAAWRDQRPARIGAGACEAAGLNRNRRVNDGPIDAQLTVVRIDRDQETLAAIVSYAAHATVLSGDNWLVSGDFPGALEAELEARGVQFPLFLNGSAGDLAARAPAPAPGGFARVEAIGRALADRVSALLPTIALQPDTTVAVSQATVTLPGKSTSGTVGWPLDWIATPLAAPYLRSETTMQALRVGDVVLVTFPGDLNVLVGRQLKQCFKGTLVVPVSYADDYIGYIVDPESYDARTYEASLSFYGREAGAFLARWGESLVHAVLGGGP